MDSYFLFLLVIVGIAALAALVFFVTRRPPNPENDAAADYAAGLNYLVTGDLQLALRKLKDAVRKNTDNIDAYIKIGDILRDTGHPDQAIKVHRDLTARTSLSSTDKLLILRSLVADFESKSAYDSALTVIERIYEIKRDDLWARERELQLHEATKDWKRAEQVYRKLAKQKNMNDPSRLAYYRLETGRQLYEAGRAKEGRDALRDAMKVDPSYFAAYEAMSDRHVDDGQLSDALNVLKKFVQKNPDTAAQAFDKIKELLFRIGEFGEIENVYSRVIADSPSNWDAYLALAELKDKKGEVQDAIRLCQQILQKNPDYKKAREHLVRYYHRIGDDSLAVEQALALLESTEEEETPASPPLLSAPVNATA